MMSAFYQAIQSYSSDWLDSFFILMSFLGSEPIYIVLISLIFWNIDKRFGFRLSVLFLASMSLNGICKDLLHFQRPIGNPNIRSLYVSSAAGWSFPSGHSQGAATFYPYLWHLWPNKFVKAIGIMMIALIGFSRLYLGVHWPQDVVAGIGIGLLLVFIFQRIDRSMLKLHFSLPVKILLSLGIPLLFLPVYHTKEGFQLIGYLSGFACGYFFEDTYLDYREKTKAFPSFKKTLLGLAILAAWVWLWLPWIHTRSWLYLPVMLVGGLWVSFGAPFLFRHLHWESQGVSESVESAPSQDA